MNNDTSLTPFASFTSSSTSSTSFSIPNVKIIMEGQNENNQTKSIIPLIFILKCSIDFPTPKIPAAIKLLTENGFSNRNEDKFYQEHELWFEVERKVIGHQNIEHDAIFEYQPWYNDVLTAIRKHDPNFKESDLQFISEGHCNIKHWNHLAFRFYKCPWTESIDIFDENFNKITISVINDKVPRYKEMVDKVVNELLRL